MFKLSFRTSNAAFEDDPNYEIARILRDIAVKVEVDGRADGSIRDANGNTIGSWTTGVAHE